MIPKKIHYCWVGNGELTPLAKRCIESWKKFCPDYEIIRWDESNYDFTKHPYMKDAYEARKWGFVPDYARLDIVHQHGGIYLDTDVEIIKNIDELLDNKCFFGFESEEMVNLGEGFGAEAAHPMLKKMLGNYDNCSFYTEDGKLNLLPSPQIQTKVLKVCGLKKYDGKIQKLADVTIYPCPYFAPYNQDTGKMKVTGETCSIHWYSGSWLTPWMKFKTKLKPLFYKLHLAGLAKKILKSLGL